MRKVEREIKEIIFHHIDPEKYKIFIFGSRVSGKSGKYSDYDIGILGKHSLSLSTIGFIKEEMDESNIPFQVDIVDFTTVSSNFKKIALSKIRELK
ncbi:MAG: nucleotidyltransferase domain-containing protein [Actinobacteria bacterium]|nr:nucleotidyltransferase domain-containing protein [Actinomycetota bacterium]MCL5674436.1 nucleotidyltransferase domain-containing protein [Candidatus Omnitrophota bacterium]